MMASGSEIIAAGLTDDPARKRNHEIRGLADMLAACNEGKSIAELKQDPGFRASCSSIDGQIDDRDPDERSKIEAEANRLIQ